MTEPPKPQDVSGGGAPAGAAAKVDAKAGGNPAFRMMGLPRLRAKLPSRNWTIFLTIVGSFTAAVTYDRRQKKKIQQKWCNAVSHISKESVPTNLLLSKFTIHLAAPPGDGLRAARDHFREYIKPVLVAAAVDWEVVEGQREGELRENVAKRIRDKRREDGEESMTPLPKDVLLEVRSKMNVQKEVGGGDIILGRHTWKEYVRGIHEGWLGPMDDPNEDQHEAESPMYSAEPTSSQDPLAPPESTSFTSVSNSSEDSPTIEALDAVTQDDTSHNTEPAPKKHEKETESKQDEEPKSKPKPIPSEPYIRPSEYHAASLAPSTPQTFYQSVVVPFPHLLGFLNTPVRLYRFLNRRKIAEETGHQVASLILAGSRELEYSVSDSYESPLMSSEDSNTKSWEQQGLLVQEEGDWRKSAVKPNPPEDAEKERPWIEDMVIDERIGTKMKKPELVPDPAISNNRDFADDSSDDKLDSGTEIRGHYREWKGGADNSLDVTWGQWLKESFGFEDNEPRCKGWEHGEVDS